MTSHELAKKLLELPDRPVTLEDSEYGTIEIHTINPDVGYYKAGEIGNFPADYRDEACITLR